MLMPKRVKYRKAQRGRMKGKAQRGSTLAFGEFGLKALEPGWVTNRQIEAARVSLARSVKRGGKIFIRIFPDKPVTKKPAETRMGKGKGNPEFWVAVVKPGPHHVRDGGGGRGDGQGRVPPGRPEDRHQDQVRDPHAGALRRAMKAAKWREMSDDELQQKAQELGEELFNLRFQLSHGRGQESGPGGDRPAGSGPGPDHSPRSGRCASRGTA